MEEVAGAEAAAKRVDVAGNDVALLVAIVVVFGKARPWRGVDEQCGGVPCPVDGKDLHPDARERMVEPSVARQAQHEALRDARCIAKARHQTCLHVRSGNGRLEALGDCHQRAVVELDVVVHWSRHASC